MMNVELEIHNGVKYEDFEVAHKVRYSITSFEVVDGEAAAEIEKDTDDDGIDEYHEYLVLHLADGETSTFRNSHVDMFRV